MIETLQERRDKLEELYSVWENRNVYEQFLWAQEHFTDLPFLITDMYSMSYRQTKRKINQIAAALKNLGVHEEDHVAVCIKNGAEFVLVSFALFQLGAVKVPTNQKLSQEELIDVFEQSDTDYIISQWEFDDSFLELLSNLKAAVSLEKKTSENEKTILLCNLLNNQKSLYTEFFWRIVVLRKHCDEKLL